MSTQLPFMSLRGQPLFPGNTTILEIGRPFTIASIKKAASSYGGKLVIASQKYIEMNDKPDPKQIYSMGTVCQILNSTEFPDGMMKLQVQTLERFEIADLIDEDGARFCKGNPMANAFSEELSVAEQKTKIRNAMNVAMANEKSEVLQHALRDLNQTTDGFVFVAKACYLLGFKNGLRKELTLEQMNSGIFVIDTLTENEKASLNLNVARVQEILEEKSLMNALNKVSALVI